MGMAGKHVFFPTRAVEVWHWATGEYYLAPGCISNSLHLDLHHSDTRSIGNSTNWPVWRRLRYPINTTSYCSGNASSKTFGTSSAQ